MYNFFGKKVSGLFTIPSGIITTSVSNIKWVIKNIPEVGIITTKSIGLLPKEGNREPIYLKYGKDAYMNAVGLTNPGAEEFSKNLDCIEIPHNKFLLCSIFGGSIEEFSKVAKILKDKVDGFELNVSCPHDSGHGQAIGQDFELTASIVREVKKLGKPVLVKLSPNISPISEVVKKCEEAGADGFCAINTLGPGYFTVNGYPVLTNSLGGMSGHAIFPIGLKIVKEIRDNTLLPIIAGGGIRGLKEVAEYERAGADFFSIGSSLTGMNSEDVKNFFSELSIDIRNRSNISEILLKPMEEMEYVEIKLEKKEDLSDDLTLLTFNKKLKVGFGQYIFLWIPEIGEKPFSVYRSNPFTLLIQKVGKFTSTVMDLKVGADMYFRGPYGKVPQFKGKILVVGGGSGIASFGLLEDIPNNKYLFLFGARSSNRIPNKKMFQKLGELIIATNDGSDGHKGFITELLNEKIQFFDPNYILNCGSIGMMNAALKIEQEYLDASKIYSSIDRLTKCGVGICGSCAREDGLRTCIDGPFLPPII